MATFYFNGAVDSEWTNLGNWWMDDQFTVPATSLPTSADSVIATANITSNSGSEPTLTNFTITGFYLYLSINLTVTGEAAINNGTFIYGTITGNVTLNTFPTLYGTINGNVTLNDGSFISQGVINGDVTFNDYSFNLDGTINGNCTFNDFTYNIGTVNGDAIFNHNSYNAVSVIGNATFNNSSYNEGGVSGNATFQGSSYNSSTATIGGTETYTNRTTYPIPRGINNSNILGLI